jgi:hypothetical protein
VIVRDDFALCSVMIIELWTRNREMGEKGENNVENTNEYEEQGYYFTVWVGKTLYHCEQTPKWDS